MPDFLQRRTAICAILPTVLFIATLSCGIFHAHWHCSLPLVAAGISAISPITTLTVNVIHLLLDSSFPYLMIPPTLGRRLSLPVAGWGILSITGIAHFPTMSLLIMVTVDHHPLGPLSLVMAPSTPFWCLFLLDAGSLSLYKGVSTQLRTGSISFLCFSMPASICPIPLSVCLSVWFLPSIAWFFLVNWPFYDSQFLQCSLPVRVS